MRLIYADGKNLTETDHVRKAPDKVFAVIGPFENHQDKRDLQELLFHAVRNWIMDKNRIVGAYDESQVRRVGKKKTEIRLADLGEMTDEDLEI